MKSLASTGSFLWALVVVLLALIGTGHSFRQELWLYDAQENAHLFHSHVSDTSYLSSFLPKVTRLCTRGKWSLFSTTNFETYVSTGGMSNDTDLVCINYTTGTSLKSFRHLAANDTGIDALSLYLGGNWSHKEIVVTARAYTGITMSVGSIAGTGTSDWMLFEGMNLDGRSTCYTVPRSGWYLNYDHVNINSINLTKVGSVFKGCDVQEIQNYKISLLNSN